MIKYPDKSIFVEKGIVSIPGCSSDSVEVKEEFQLHHIHSQEQRTTESNA